VWGQVTVSECKVALASTSTGSQLLALMQMHIRGPTLACLGVAQGDVQLSLSMDRASTHTEPLELQAQGALGPPRKEKINSARCQMLCLQGG